jgi:soluble epoxide hydrolase / lipid-phosphate phosphatase
VRGIDAPWASELATEESKSLDIPTLLIGAEFDYICRPELQKQGVEQYLRNHRIVQLQSGHWILLEQPDELAELLDGFTKDL